MEQESTKPTLTQFTDVSRKEFSFLRELGYSELQESDPGDPFNVRFSNGELTVSIQGENWGEHAATTSISASLTQAVLETSFPHSARSSS